MKDARSFRFYSDAAVEFRKQARMFELFGQEDKAQAARANAIRAESFARLAKLGTVTEVQRKPNRITRCV